MTTLDDRVEVLERRVETLRRYLEEDRQIVESVDRLDTGVGNLATIMERLEINSRQIQRVEAQSKSLGREAISENRRTKIESRIYSALIVMFILLSAFLLLDHFSDESQRRRDLQRVAKQNCELGNERVDYVAKLARDLTAGASPEGKARVEKALVPYLQSKRDCEALP